MASSNKKNSFPNEKTHGGSDASRVSIKEQLKRSALGCMLWEDSFYEDGVSIAERIKSLVSLASEDDVREILFQAKFESKLRHLPLYILVLLAEKGCLKKEDVEKVVTRADDMTELLSLYWKDGKKPLDKQLAKGLKLAFHKFGEYNLAKYNRDKDIKLKDVLKMVRPKPVSEEESVLWKKLLNDELATPDTWEVAISACKNDAEKKEVWERLLTENKLGSLAFLRNLRNMEKVCVTNDLISNAFENIDFSKILPFQFVIASQYAHRFETSLEKVFLSTLSQKQKLKGRTVVAIDVSGSMYGYGNISKNSEISRAKAACAVAAIARELCEEPIIYATGGNDYTRIHQTKLVPARRGFALIDAVYKMKDELGGGGIFLKQMCDYIREKETNVERIIVFTDEQDCSGDKSTLNVLPVGKRGYIINVSVEKNGIAYNKNWTHISGFSESCINYIIKAEE